MFTWLKYPRGKARINKKRQPTYDTQLESNQGHTGPRQVLVPLYHIYSPKLLNWVLMKLKWHIWQRTELLSGLTLVAFNYTSQAGTDLGGKKYPWTPTGGAFSSPYLQPPALKSCICHSQGNKMSILIHVLTSHLICSRCPAEKLII